MTGGASLSARTRVAIVVLSIVLGAIALTFFHPASPVHRAVFYEVRWTRRGKLLDFDLVQMRHVWGGGSFYEVRARDGDLLWDGFREELTGIRESSWIETPKFAFRSRAAWKSADDGFRPDSVLNALHREGDRPRVSEGVLTLDTAAGAAAEIRFDSEALEGARSGMKAMQDRPGRSDG